MGGYGIKKAARSYGDGRFERRGIKPAFKKGREGGNQAAFFSRRMINSL